MLVHMLIVLAVTCRTHKEHGQQTLKDGACGPAAAPARAEANDSSRHRPSRRRFHDASVSECRGRDAQTSAHAHVQCLRPHRGMRAAAGTAAQCVDRGPACAPCWQLPPACNRPACQTRSRPGRRPATRRSSRCSGRSALRCTCMLEAPYFADGTAGGSLTFVQPRCAAKSAVLDYVSTVSESRNSRVDAPDVQLHRRPILHVPDQHASDRNPSRNICSCRTLNRNVSHHCKSRNMAVQPCSTPTLVTLNV